MMELEGIKTLTQVGPWGAIALIAIIYVIREYLATQSKKEKLEENTERMKPILEQLKAIEKETDNEKIKPILDKLDIIESNIQKILIDFEKKVPYDHLEAKYLSKEVTIVMLDNMRDSIKRAHERIDTIEKGGKP